MEKRVSQRYHLMCHPWDQVSPTLHEIFKTIFKASNLERMIVKLHSIQKTQAQIHLTFFSLQSSPDPSAYFNRGHPKKLTI